MAQRTTERLDYHGVLVDAVKVTDCQIVKGEKILREYVEVYEADRVADPAALISWHGTVEGFTRMYAGAERRNF